MDIINGAMMRYGGARDIEAAQNIQKRLDYKINGDYVSDFKNSFTNAADKTALPSGAAANSASASSAQKKIDKTSLLYEKSLELESYIIKIMLSSMRGSLTGASFAGEKASYAQKMYEDMFYDELAVTMTKNAGFGLADQVYMQLSQN
ncbi:rod-binding protein [Treponema sp. OMZ 840]|uniref:rod-binding protein n=1 Tax=Treponema sp. OMZ 840 TaxID=244313 RepID=UPI003D8BF608